LAVYCGPAKGAAVFEVAGHGHADGAEAGGAKTTATAQVALFARNGAAVQREVQAGGRTGW
jgi:hypothetical protein